MERKILSSCAVDRSVFNKLEAIGYEEHLSDTGKIIFGEISSFYTTDSNAGSIDYDILQARLIRKYPRQQDLFTNLVELMKEDDVSAVNVLKECMSLAERNIGLKLSAALQSDSPDVRQLVEEYQDLEAKIFGAEASENVGTYNGVGIDELFSQDGISSKLKMLPNSLNDRIGGGIEGGDNILIFARPECGKSLFAINAAAGFLMQGARVLYYGNEDPAQRMLRRFLSRLSGRTAKEIIETGEAALRRAEQRGYNNLYFVKGNRNSFPELTARIESIEPNVLIIDQLRHMETGNDNRVQQLEEAAIRARGVASEYNIPVISVTQAGDSAEGKLVLGQGDVDYSNTGIPGAMDLMIGVGANEEFLRNDMRRISLPKNKLDNIHSSWDVLINPALSKVIDT